MKNTVDSPVQPCASSDDGADDKPKDKTHWIKFKLVNNEDGNPLEDIVLDLELPDGNFTVVETNDKGEVEISNIDPGSCKLHSDWRELIEQGITVEQMVFIQ